MTFDLTGRTAFITGASRGIGAATARRLAEAGANVVLAARSSQVIDAIAADIGSNALAVTCDVANYEQVEAAIAKTIGRFGGVQIVVNNAGLIDPIARLDESDPAAWGHVIDVNVKGVYHVARAALPAMLQEGSGTIINISSGAATGALEGWSHYCSSKAAVLSLTKCLHREYAEHGIRTIGLSPGTVATDMQTSIRASGINPVSQLDWSTHIPPEWVAETIAWMAAGNGRDHDGTDFSLKTEEGRAAVGLPALKAG